MSVIFVVLPLALLVVLAAVVAFLWAAHRGQFDDLTTPAIRMLHDDEESRDDGDPTSARTEDAKGDEARPRADTARPRRGPRGGPDDAESQKRDA